MQSLSGLSNSDFLTKGQIPLVKLEVYHGAGNYIATMTFDSGSVKPKPNEILTGVTSDTTAKVIRVTLASGAWTDGNAAGTIDLAFCDDRFFENETINGSVGGSNILTVNNPDTAAGVDGFVTNGSMEVDDDWVGYGTPTGAIRSGEFKRTGVKSWRIAVNGAGDGVQMDTDVYPTLVLGKTYRISAWIYWRDTNLDPPDAVTFRLGDTGDGGVVLDTTSVDVSVTRDGWVEVAFTAKCTTGGTTRLYVVHRATAPYYPPVFYVDDVTIYEDVSWLDLSNLEGENYLEDFSVNLGGAKMLPDPIAGEWNAIINNQDGIFHPEHPASFYSDLFEEGKKVRISLGATYSSVDYYWQRLIGYMEEPSYEGKSHKVNISGYDYMKLLMDTELRKKDTETWGSSETFDSVSSEGPTEDELYAELDAMEIGGGEANSVAQWTPSANITIVSQADTGGGSTWVGKINTAVIDVMTIRNTNVGTLVSGSDYKLTFKYKRVHGGAYPMNLLLLQTVSGSETICGGESNMYADSWTQITIYFTALVSGALIMQFEFGDEDQEWRIDEISLKEQATGSQRKSYVMPADCNGVFYVTLDGEEVFQDAEDEGWRYNEVLNLFFFDKDKVVEAGSDNLIVHYYIDQTLENVVADLLVKAGLYADQAAALTGMNYTATSITTPQVFFNVGSSCLEAVKLCCERAEPEGYRFFFQYDGTPDFNPPPTAEIPGSEDVDLHEGTYSEPSYYRDKSELWNRVVIEGLEQGQRVAPESAMKSELRGEEHDDTSIAKYKEHTKTIKNHLFQTQAAIDAMCIALLALRKDPKYYFDSTLDFNPIPLEIGDTMRQQVPIAVGTGNKYNQFVYGDGTKYGGGAIVVIRRGLIRDISIDRFDVQYKCEEVT